MALAEIRDFDKTRHEARGFVVDRPSRLPIGGDRLEGKYGIEREIGRGSIGIVYAAWHLGLDRRVAIKVLRPELAMDEDAVARFQKQAKAAAALTSEGAAKVFDVGRLTSGAPYIVMEFLDGENLETIVKRDGVCDPVRAIDLMVAACEAIEEAHQRRIIHRAIEPKNLFIPRDSSVTLIKVIDFGLARTAQSKSGRCERRAIITSASAFNAPELFSGMKIDSRADIWSVGATLHFLLTGRAPFEGDRAFQVCAKILSTDPPRLRAHRPEAPEPLERLIAKCMRRDPEDRHQTMREVLRALRDVKRELAVLPKSDPIPQVTVRSTLRMRTAGATPKRPSPAIALRNSCAAFDPIATRRSLLLLTATCCFIVLLGMLAGWTLGRRAISTSKRVAVTTSTSPSLFARR